MSRLIISVRGEQQLTRLARVMKEHADGKELRKDLLKGLNQAVTPIIAEQKLNLRTELPQRGGLAAYMTKSTFRKRMRLTGTKARVNLEVSKRGGDLRSIERGRVRHPVFGNRTNWATQYVPAGLLSDPVKNNRLLVRQYGAAAIRETSDKIARQVR